MSSLDDIIGKIIVKMLSNLTHFPNHLKLLQNTLETFSTFITGYSHLKTISQMPFIKNLMENHANAYFTFLSQSINDKQHMKLRIKYYTILGKILFQNEEYDLLTFMKPFDIKLKYMVTTLKANQNQSEEKYMNEYVTNVEMLLSILIDFEGILSVATTQTHYMKFFDWFFFDYFDLQI